MSSCSKGDTAASQVRGREQSIIALKFLSVMLAPDSLAYASLVLMEEI